MCLLASFVVQVTVFQYKTMGLSKTASICTVIQETKDELPFPKNHRGEKQDAYQTNCRIVNITSLLDSGEVLGIGDPEP